jgi:radical SAM/Cys-rich protein
MPLQTLLRQAKPLADPTQQRAILAPRPGQQVFDQVLVSGGVSPLRATGIEVLQVNVGKVCNQTCRHCHVDAGPERREIMNRKTMEACLRVLAETEIPTLDVTGGAPEMNPHFRWFVGEARQLHRRVIDRCNLTILLAPGHADLATFLAERRVEIVASLPCYLERNTDAQRGDGVFVKSITALRLLNSLGYGRPDSGLTLNLVYNPLGPSLPPQQDELEVDYRRELAERYGIVFNRLFTIANMPISRFLDDLSEAGQLEQYMQQLIAAFNPAAVTGLMCRTMISVGWDGRLYDCDFNQMLEIGIASGRHAMIHDLDLSAFRSLATRTISTGQHCFGCTAGAGSSCQGAIIDSAS